MKALNKETFSYSKFAEEIGDLVAIKQDQYGDSHGKAGEILKILYPDGVDTEDMDDMLTLIRIIDKLFRVANGNKGDEDAYKDIVGYALLAAAENEMEKRKEEAYQDFIDDDDDENFDEDEFMDLMEDEGITND